MKSGIKLIAEERAQHDSKGWDAKHDDLIHSHGEIALIAAKMLNNHPDQWGLTKKTWNEGGRIRQLVVAGSLVAAEIDRLLRLELEPVVVPWKGPADVEWDAFYTIPGDGVFHRIIRADKLCVIFANEGFVSYGELMQSWKWTKDFVSFFDCGKVKAP